MLNRHHPFTAVFQREFRTLLSRKLYLFVVIGLPLFSLIFLATIFGDGQIENVPVGIVDQTNSPLTRRIIREVAATPTFEVTPAHIYQSEQEARAALQKMDIYAYLVIPSDFEAQLYNGLNPTLRYYYHYAVLSVGEEVKGSFETVLGGVSATLLEETGRKAGLSGAQLTALALPTSARNFPIYNPDLDFSVYLSYPFFFIFLQIIILVFVVYSVGMELKTGTARQWMETAAGNPLVAVAGKLAPYLIIFSVEILLAHYVFFYLVKIPFACPVLPLILSGILLVAATMSIGIILITLVPQLPISISFASMLGALGATTCGVTFPVDGMYPVFEHLSYLFPVRLFTHINHNLLYSNLGFGYSWPYFVALAAFILPALLLVGRLYRVCTDRTFRPLSPYYGIALIVLGGTLGYGFLYNLLYNPNTLKEIPIAVVDNSQSELGARYTRYLNATKGVHVLTNAPDFQQARQLMEAHQIRGIIYLPADFGKRVNNGEESVFLLYETTTSFLYYVTIQENALSAMLQINEEYRTEIIQTLPDAAKLQLAQAPSLNISGIPLYNPGGGYGSFLLPIVFIVVMFQTLLMAQGAYCGMKNEERKVASTTHRCDHNAPYSPLRQMAASAAPFVAVYFLLSFFLLGWLPGIFSLPAIGNPLLIFPFILLFLITTGAAGLALSFLYRDSESCMLLIPFFSIGLIFLSGMSFPTEQIPWFWQGFSYLLPSTPGITGYIKLNTMGSGFSAILPEILTLFAQLAGYTLLAFLVFRKNN